MSTTQRRKYESPVRRERAAKTRESILAAGCELVGGFPIGDWRGLTIRAVARRAGVNERTVYRHFLNERALHQAVLRRLQEEAGVPLDGFTLDEFATLVARMYRHLSSYSIAPASPRDPAFAEVEERRRREMLAAVEETTPAWSQTEREMAAALLDVLKGVGPYVRMVGRWGLDAEHATLAVTGLIRLLVESIHEGRRPWVAE
jgi:AcrR family transcriptional regulator